MEFFEQFKKRGFQKELAKKLSISPSRLTQYLRGHRFPNKEKIQEISHLLGSSFEELEHYFQKTFDERKQKTPNVHEIPSFREDLKEMKEDIKEIKFFLEKILEILAATHEGKMKKEILSIMNNFKIESIPLKE